MTKRKLVFLSMFMLFVLVAFAAVTTLTTPLYSGPTTEIPDAQGGNWEFVCCGSNCDGGQDYCVGSGTYSCCK